MTYEELLIKSEHDNLIVKEKDIPGYGGRNSETSVPAAESAN